MRLNATENPLRNIQKDLRIVPLKRHHRGNWGGKLYVWGLPTADKVNPAVGQGNTGHTVSATQDYGGCPTFHSTNIKCIYLILNSKNIYQQYFKILDCVHFQLSPSTIKHPLQIYQNITKR